MAARFDIAQFVVDWCAALKRIYGDTHVAHETFQEMADYCDEEVTAEDLENEHRAMENGVVPVAGIEFGSARRPHRMIKGLRKVEMITLVGGPKDGDVVEWDSHVDAVTFRHLWVGMDVKPIFLLYKRSDPVSDVAVYAGAGFD